MGAAVLCFFLSLSTGFAFKTRTALHSVSSFEAFQEHYGRTLQEGSPEYALRSQLFHEQLVKVDQHNSNPKRMWDAEINHLSDRTEAELSQLLGWRGVATSRRGSTEVGEVGQHRPGNFLMQRQKEVLPEEMSWSNLSTARQEVDQGGCGSCWAIATAMVLQANAEVKGVHRTFSPQEIVDCTPNPHSCGGTGGCEGSTVELALNWISSNGLSSSEEVPYIGESQSCRAAARGTSFLGDAGVGDQSSYSDDELEHMIAIGVHKVPPGGAGSLLGLKAWERLPENKYLPLMRAVATHGPVAISVAASPWRSYGRGIFNDCSRDAVIDHAVMLIGYGKDSGYDAKYWLVKNSWGLSWGDEGNIRLMRSDTDETDQCGTDDQPEVGTGCQGGPSSVRVCGMCGILYDAVVPYF